MCGGVRGVGWKVRRRVPRRAMDASGRGAASMPAAHPRLHPTQLPCVAPTHEAGPGPQQGRLTAGSLHVRRRNELQRTPPQKLKRDWMMLTQRTRLRLAGAGVAHQQHVHLAAYACAALLIVPRRTADLQVDEETSCSGLQGSEQTSNQRKAMCEGLSCGRQQRRPLLLIPVINARAGTLGGPPPVLWALCMLCVLWRTSISSVASLTWKRPCSSGQMLATICNGREVGGHCWGRPCSQLRVPTVTSLRVAVETVGCTQICTRIHELHWGPMPASTIEHRAQLPPLPPTPPSRPPCPPALPPSRPPCCALAAGSPRAPARTEQTAAPTLASPLPPPCARGRWTGRWPAAPGPPAWQGLGGQQQKRRQQQQQQQ